MGDATTFRVVLTTVGRKTGKEHTVPLRAVVYGGKFYFSRHKPDGDWYLNAVTNSTVRMTIGGQNIAGVAREVIEADLLQKISELKYPGEARAKERRVAIEVSVDDAPRPRQP